MRNIKHLAATTTLALAAAAATAQGDAQLKHYWAAETAYNPAAAGKGSRLNVVAAYNITYAGFDNSPKTVYASVDMPIRLAKSNHGVGAQFVSDNAGVFTHQRLALQYAYKRTLWGGTMSVGASLGLMSEKMKAADIDLEESGDNAFPTTDASGTAIDMGVGLYYTRGELYAALSIAHATAPTIAIGEKQDYNVKSAYYFTAGYNIRLKNPFLKIKPSALATMGGGTYRADITCRLAYEREQKMLYCGAGLSTAKSAVVLVGGNFHGVTIGYAYELFATAIKPANGSHELMVTYTTDIDLGKKGKNRHKSVRLL